MTKQEVKNEVLKIMKNLNISHMPTRSELELTGNAYLMNHIARKFGGFAKLREEMNLPKKPTSIKWTDEIILEEITKVVKILNVDYLPSHKEIKNITGNDALTGVMSKRKSYREWAELLNLKIKESDTYTGHQGEDLMKNLIESKEYNVERLSTNCLYDFLINDQVRVDCKISNLYHGKNGNFYSYNLERPNPDCDIFILITNDDENKKKLLIIPQQVLKGQKQVSIGEFKSKWYKYENRYDFIDKYIEFYKELV